MRRDNERNPGQTKDRITSPTKQHQAAPLAQPANSGGLRMLYLWPNPLSCLATTSKLSRSSPPPVRPRVDFATLLVLPIAAQSQSRLKRPDGEPWNPPAYNSITPPPPTNATVTGPCGKGRRWHTGAVRACLHELCQGQVQMHVWRSCWRMREVRYYYCCHSVDHFDPWLGLPHVETQTESQYNQFRAFLITSVPPISTHLLPHPRLFASFTHPILGVSACRRTASHQCRIANELRKRYQDREQLT